MVESWLVVEPQVNKIKKDITAVHHQPKNFYGASFAVEKLSKLERPSLHPDDFKEFVRVRYKKLSTNQNRGII